MKVAPEKVKTLPADPEIDHSGLSRVQLKTELRQQRYSETLGLLGFGLGAAQHDEVVRITDDFTRTMLRPGPVEGVQVDVGKQRGDDASNAIANFEFDVSLPYVKGEKRGRKVRHYE
jgi:hypothetical protein